MNDDYKEHQRTNEVEYILENSEAFSEKVNELIENKMEEQDVYSKMEQNQIS